MRPHPSSSRVIGLSVLALPFLLGGVPSALTGQGVTGQVVDETTSAPLAGVLLSLVDATGARVGEVLSAGDGRFTIPARRTGRFTLSAERIGLRTEISDAFDVSGSDFVLRRVVMTDRAVSIDGLVVDARVQSCRLDPVTGLRIQRWWGEIRKALEVSSLVQERSLARFRVQQFERTWSADLRSVASENTSLRIGFSTRPFVSASADRLAEGGFVQGEAGRREYFAPDADVLLSDVFLAQHCFSLVEDQDEEGRIGIHFEPTRSNKVAEILGTLWVDTTSAELTKLDYRYANLDWLPANEAGGEVAFRYLPSGAWIVSDWFIRMPRAGVRRERRSGGTVDATLIAGYVDVGGRVRQLTTTTGAGDGAVGSGEIRGQVFDSIRGGPLVGARVTVLGTRFSTTTDASGAFVLDNLPRGSHDVTFFHADLVAWGLSSPFEAVTLEDGQSVDLELAVPRFRTAARAMCGPEAERVDTVLTGIVVDAEGRPRQDALVDAAWQVGATASGVTRTARFEMFTGSDGRYRICSAPGEARVAVGVEVDERHTDAFEVVLPGGAITVRAIRARR